MNTWISNAMTSQRTTIGGILLALGGVLSGADKVWPDSPPWLILVGMGMAAVGGVLMTQARQGNVSSEEVRRAERGFASVWTSLGVVFFTAAACACFSGCLSLTPYSSGSLSSNNVKVTESTATENGVDTFALEIKSRGDAAAKTSVKYTGEAAADTTPWAFAVLGEANVESATRVLPLNEGAGAALAALPETLGPLVAAFNAAPAGEAGASVRDTILREIIQRVLARVTGGVNP